jgi:hypothetical protein
VLSQERSFNRLCKLITQARDDEDTAVEITELLNDLYGKHSDLSIIRALARKVGRPTGGSNVRRSDTARADRRRVERNREIEESPAESVPAEARRHALRLVAAASASSSRPANHSG